MSANVSTRTAISSRPDPASIDKWRADTRNEWSAEPVVAAWRTWGRGNIRAQADATDALIREAGIEPGHSVLDVAGGGGDPSLAVARIVGSAGSVTVTDVSPGMLETARLFAEEEGLDNIDYCETDAIGLPFDDATFDRAVCRCAVMFFADLDRSLREICRVLKPGGRAAFLAWRHVQGIPLFSSIFGPMAKYMDSPPAPPPPGTPWPFKFADDGVLSEALTAAGYEDVRESTLVAAYRWPGPSEQVLEMMQEMGGLKPMLADLPADRREALLSEALENYRAFESDGVVTMSLAYALASGCRP
jgi:SAM-dependent methyltransferase